MSNVTRILTVLVTISSLAAHASDFDRDSVHTGQLGSPLTDLNIALPAQTAAALAQSLQGCVSERYSTLPSGLKVDNGAVSICPDVVVSDQLGDMTETMQLQLADGEVITAMSFDGANSDGGDEIDVGIYNEAGQRIGAMPNNYGCVDLIAVLANRSHVAISGMQN